jgi:hypothetical protein
MQLFWARNDDAAIVVAHLHRKLGPDGVYRCRKINRRRLQAGEAVPPCELLRGLAASWTNEDTYRASRKLKVLVSEYATYDASGQFLYKSVSIPRLQVMYASRLKKDAELPMAVEILPNRAK